ncbi:MAG: SAM-dependent methyltransferase, partial [Actinobacteria bacterium]|nr:SAM-dependent methyltransferase [Actinomycetota bacterium]
DALLGAAADRTRRTLLLTYPQDRLLVRLLVRAADRFLRARGSTFQVYVHPVGRIEAVAAAHGLRPQARVRHGVAWESAVFAR